MGSLWAAFAAIWAALALGSVETASARPRIADANIPQAMSVGGLVLLMGLGSKAGDRNAPSLAVALVALLMLGALAARATLGGSWSADVRAPVDGVQVTEGAYGLTRHPIYACVGAAALLTALATRRPTDLAGAALVVGGLAWKASIEDEALARYTRGDNVVALADYRK